MRSLFSPQEWALLEGRVVLHGTHGRSVRYHVRRKVRAHLEDAARLARVRPDLLPVEVRTALVPDPRPRLVLFADPTHARTRYLVRQGVDAALRRAFPDIRHEFADLTRERNRLRFEELGLAAPPRFALLDCTGRLILQWAEPSVEAVRIALPAPLPV